MMTYSSSVLGLHPPTIMRGYNQHRSLHRSDTDRQKAAVRKTTHLYSLLNSPWSVPQPAMEEKKWEDKSGSCCSTGGEGGVGEPPLWKGTPEEEGTGLMMMMMMMMAVVVERWKGGVNSWILMKTGGNVHVIVLFLLIKCYLAQDLGLFTSASLAPEGSVRTEGQISQWKQKHWSGLICIFLIFEGN